ncbi:MAG TPA: hypothetical protein VF618_02465 [Thermoanaerobaculia bacterium]
MQIGFRGLIAFLEPDSVAPRRYLAALMKHHHIAHVAVLSVPTESFREKESTLPGRVKGDLTCFELRGRIMTSLGSAVPMLKINDVPLYKLGFPSGKTIHKTAKDGQPDAARFKAVFEFPAGDLTINDYFKHEGTFDGKNYVCIPRSLLFTVASANPVTFYIGSRNQTVVVDGAAFVTITNLDPTASGGHYSAFENLFNETTATNSPRSDKDRPCQKQPGETIYSCTTGGADPDVDCSPVRYP